MWGKAEKSSKCVWRVILTDFGSGDDFRLMTRVLPRPLGLQGGKSMRIT